MSPFPDYMVKVTSSVVDMQELSKICMDWVSGTPREDRVTLFLFSAPTVDTAFVPANLWETTFTKRSLSTQGKVKPEFQSLFTTVQARPNIQLKSLFAELNTQTGNKMFKVEFTKKVNQDGSITYD